MTGWTTKGSQFWDPTILLWGIVYWVLSEGWKLCVHTKMTSIGYPTYRQNLEEWGDQGQTPDVPETARQEFHGRALLAAMGPRSVTRAGDLQERQRELFKMSIFILKMSFLSFCCLAEDPRTYLSIEGLKVSSTGDSHMAKFPGLRDWGQEGAGKSWSPCEYSRFFF